MGNRLAIIAMALVTVGLTGILLLISNVLFGGVTAAIVAAVALIGVATLWFGVPLHRSWRESREP
jgi:spore maturation protein SpmA